MSLTYTRAAQGHAPGVHLDPETGLRYGAADSHSLVARAIGF